MKQLSYSHLSVRIELFWKYLYGLADLDWRSEMIIFESILTTFEKSIVFKAA